MSAEIFGDRFRVLGQRKAAWWDIAGAYVLPEEMDPMSATRAAGCDFNVITLPRAIYLPNGQIIKSDDSVNIVREPLGDEMQYVDFGVASKDFTMLQNIEIAEMLMPLGEKWHVETVGALGKGEKFFICFRAHAYSVAGDEITNYIVFSDVKTPGETLKYMLTPIRTECTNTFVFGMQQARSLRHINHSKSIKADVAAAVELVQELAAEMGVKEDVLKTMAKVRISDKDVSKVLDAVYPAAKPSRRAQLLESLAGKSIEMDADYVNGLQKAADRDDHKTLARQAYAAGCVEAYALFNEQYPEAAGTPYALYNSIVEVEDFRKGSGHVGESALFGWRAGVKMRAWQLTSEYAIKTAKKQGIEVPVSVN